MLFVLRSEAVEQGDGEAGSILTQGRAGSGHGERLLLG